MSPGALSQNKPFFAQTDIFRFSVVAAATQVTKTVLQLPGEGKGYGAGEGRSLPLPRISEEGGVKNGRGQPRQ